MRGWFISAWREVIGLFVDDGSFAAAILAWIAGGGICIHLFKVPPDGEAFIFVVGLVLLLVENVQRIACTRRG